MIHFRQVGKSFDGGASWAIRDIRLTVQTGEWFVFLGSSGSGKSTLLKTVLRLVGDFEGTIEVRGQDILQMSPTTLRRSIGYVFQDIGLFPHWTIAENVEAVPRLLGWSKDQRRKRAQELLALMGLDPSIFADRYPTQLSGGQRQRVGVARAMAGNPDYLLMDEPFGALDGVKRHTLQQQMLTLKRSLNKTALFITHDLFEALTLADRIGVMHEGRLVQIGTPTDLKTHPTSDFVRNLFRYPLEQLQIASNAS